MFASAPNSALPSMVVFGGVVFEMRLGHDGEALRSGTGKDPRDPPHLFCNVRRTQGEDSNL